MIDVGANAGLVSRQLLAAPAAPFVGADCFEPDPHNHALLAHNLAPFAGVRTHEAALSDAEGEAELFRGARNAGDISLAPGARLRAQGELQRRVVRLLDGQRFGSDLLAALPAEVRLVWKSDTQGHDIRIVNALSDALWERVDAALIEVRSVPLETAARERFLNIVTRFPHCHSIGRGLRRFGPDELRAFLARESEQELDLLLAHENGVRVHFQEMRVRVDSCRGSLTHRPRGKMTLTPFSMVADCAPARTIAITQAATSVTVSNRSSGPKHATGQPV
ncbi:MAG: FkbM family methyltransferase [Xanthomonadales bacterium]|nr:FkbM family methyltransferase [Xanthomonadales bacterium]